MTEAIVFAGIVIAAAIVVAAWLLTRRTAEPDPFKTGLMEAPLSAEGIPVSPSGVYVENDTVLKPGGTVLAFSQGRWWRANVVALKGDLVRIRYPGWDSKWDEDVPRGELQVDPRDL